MASDRYELTLPDEERPLLLPPPQHTALVPLWQQMPRLGEFIQRPGVSTRAFLAALAVEANKLPRDIDLRSVAVAAMNAAVTGVILGSGYGHAFLIPFRKDRGKKTERCICQLIWGYKGLVDLAYESGFLAAIHAEVVLEGETTSRHIDEHGPHFRHDLPAMVVARDLKWSQVRAAYCVWRATTGGGGVAIVEQAELSGLYRRGNVWHSYPLAMCRKTAVLRASKAWKLTGRLGMAVSLEDHAEAGKLQPPLEPIPEAADPAPSCDDFPGDAEDGEEAPASAGGLLPGMGGD